MHIICCLIYLFFLYLSQQTPMHTAAKDGNKFTIEVLDDLGADTDIKDKDGVSKTILLVMD